MARIAAPEMRGAGASFSVPAPFLGLNTRENFTSLQPTEARVLENWLPDDGSCRVRPGHVSHQAITSATSAPMITKFKGASSQKLVCSSSLGKVYDVSGSPTEIGTGYVNNRWSTTNFNGYLFGANGVDTPWRYDGTTLGATGFTGPTLTSIQTISQVRNRLWVTINNSADVYYGGIGSVTGALTAFQLSQIASGGKCVGIGSWSRDAGDGADDFTVFVFNTGEIIVYQGDPASTFSLVGKYMAPAPIGTDFLVKVGGELIVMTASGPIPVSSAIAGNAFSADALDIWGKISPSWKIDYSRHGSNVGWNAYFFDGLVYFNVATGLTNTRQYVLNTRVNAWTLYTNMPVAQVADYNGALYFGGYGVGTVYRHATGLDNGSSIIALARQGASYPLGSSKAGKATMFMPLMDADGPAQYQYALDIDFRENLLGATVYDISSSGSGMDWGDDWGGDWGASSQVIRYWQSASGYGRAFAPVVRTLSTCDSLKWFATQLVIVPGGIT